MRPGSAQCDLKLPIEIRRRNLAARTWQVGKYSVWHMLDYNACFGEAVSHKRRLFQQHPFCVHVCKPSFATSNVHLQERLWSMVFESAIAKPKDLESILRGKGGPSVASRPNSIGALQASRLLIASKQQAAASRTWMACLLSVGALFRVLGNNLGPREKGNSNTRKV